MLGKTYLCRSGEEKRASEYHVAFSVDAIVVDSETCRKGSFLFFQANLIPSAITNPFHKPRHRRPPHPHPRKRILEPLIKVREPLEPKPSPVTVRKTQERLVLLCQSYMATVTARPG